MNNEISDELLSAYFDGELTVKERARVEHWLKENPEGKRTLADYRRISRVFESFPRSEVPQEFPAEVLQMAERRMLLPDAPHPLRRKTFPVRMAAMVIGSAAMLVLTINLWWNRPSQPVVAQSSKNPAVEPKDIQPSVVPAQSHKAGNDGIDTEPAVLPESKNMASTDPVRPGLESPDEQPTPVDSGSPAGDNLADNDPPLTPFQNQATEVVATAIAWADEREAKDRTAESRAGKQSATAVMSIQVDTSNGLALVQEFLSDYRIEVEELPDSGLLKVPQENATQYGLLVMVTDTAQLVAAFSELLDKRRPYVHLAPQDPLLLADFDSGVERKIDDIVREVAENATRALRPTEKSVAEAKSAASRHDPQTTTPQTNTPQTNTPKRKRSQQQLQAERNLRKWLREGSVTHENAQVRPPKRGKDPSIDNSSRQLRIDVPANYRPRPQPALEVNRDDVQGSPATQESPAAATGVDATDSTESKSVPATTEPASEAQPTHRDSKPEPKVYKVLLVVECPVPTAPKPHDGAAGK